MKSEKGITMMSLIIYVIAMVLIVSVVGTVASSIYNDSTNSNDYSKNLSDYNNFNMYFLKDVKQTGSTIDKIQENYIKFGNGNSYTFQDNTIFFNKIAIANNVQNCTFSSSTENEKTIVTVTIKFADKFEKTIEYVLS